MDAFSHHFSLLLIVGHGHDDIGYIHRFLDLWIKTGTSWSFFHFDLGNDSDWSDVSTLRAWWFRPMTIGYQRVNPKLANFSSWSSLMARSWLCNLWKHGHVNRRESDEKASFFGGGTVFCTIKPRYHVLSVLALKGDLRLLTFFGEVAAHLASLRWCSQFCWPKQHWYPFLSLVLQVWFLRRCSQCPKMPKKLAPKTWSAAGALRSWPSLSAQIQHSRWLALQFEVTCPEHRPFNSPAPQDTELRLSRPGRRTSH